MTISTLRPDVIYTNARFYPLDGAEPFSALAVAAGRIVAIGSAAELSAHAPVGCPVVDLGGRTVIPGLIDSHLHLTMYGAFLGQVDLNGSKSIAELQERVRKHAATLGPDEWVLGGGWEQGAFAEGRYPTRHDLDTVEPNRPVVLDRVCYHAVVCNSKALELAGITRDSAPPADGEIRVDEHGEPTGILTESACGLVGRCQPEMTFAQKKDCFLRAQARAHAAGLTSVHTNDYGMLEAIQAIRQEGKLTLRVYLDETLSLEQVERLQHLTGFGDEWLRIGSVKLFQDGSLGARTAALYDPYSDDVEHPDNRGLLMMPQEQIDALVMAAHKKGMQVAIHAIGDRAVDSSLDAIEKALMAYPRADHRHRIVHLQIIDAEIIARFKALGVIAEIQPKFVNSEQSWAALRIGPERSVYGYPWKSLWDAGVVCAGGSDCPVEPLEPLWGIYAAATRAQMDRTPTEGWRPEQRLTVTQSIELFTKNAAYAAFEEDLKGTLTVGKLADFTVLDQDPFAIDPLAIKDIPVVKTVVGGRVVFGR